MKYEADSKSTEEEYSKKEGTGRYSDPLLMKMVVERMIKANNKDGLLKYPIRSILQMWRKSDYPGSFPINRYLVGASSQPDLGCMVHSTTGPSAFPLAAEKVLKLAGSFVRVICCIMS